METMELCVTACEKFSNNNEVLPSVQVASCAFGDPMGESSGPRPQSSSRDSFWELASTFLGSVQSLRKARKGRGWCCLWVLVCWSRPALEGSPCRPCLCALPQAARPIGLPLGSTPVENRAWPVIHSCIHSSIEKRCEMPSPCQSLF